MKRRQQGRQQLSCAREQGSVHRSGMPATSYVRCKYGVKPRCRRPKAQRVVSRACPCVCACACRRTTAWRDSFERKAGVNRRREVTERGGGTESGSRQRQRARAERATAMTLFEVEVEVEGAMLSKAGQHITLHLHWCHPLKLQQRERQRCRMWLDQLWLLHWRLQERHLQCRQQRLRRCPERPAACRHRLRLPMSGP